MLCKSHANDVQMLCKCRAKTMQVLCIIFPNAMQMLFVNSVKTMGKYYAKAMQWLNKPQNLKAPHIGARGCFQTRLRKSYPCHCLI